MQSSVFMQVTNEKLIEFSAEVVDNDRIEHKIEVFYFSRNGAAGHVTKKENK